MATTKGPKKIWDNCKLIGEVMRSPSTKIKFELVARDGVKYVNMRDWYQKKSDKVWKPGLSGFAIPVRLPMEGNVEEVAKQVTEMIMKAIAEAPNFALEDPANAVYAKE